MLGSAAHCVSCRLISKLSVSVNRKEKPILTKQPIPMFTFRLLVFGVHLSM